MSYTRFLITVLLVAPAISAGANPTLAQESPARRLADGPTVIPQTGRGSFGSFDRYSIPAKAAETPAPPQIEVLFVTADQSVIPPELPEQDYHGTSALQPVAVTAGEPAIDAPHAFVDVHPVVPRELNAPRRTRPDEDPSWAAALEAMDQPRSSEPRMIPRELRGGFDSANDSAVALSDIRSEPEPECKFGLVAWAIGGIAGLAILVVLLSVAMRAVRALRSRRARLSAVLASDSEPVAQAVAAKLDVASPTLPEAPAQRPQIGSRPRRGRKVERARFSAASKANSGPPVRQPVTTEKAAAGDSSLNTQRATAAQLHRGGSDQTDSVTQAAAPRQSSAEPKALSPDSNVGPFGRALAQLQVRAVRAQPMSH